MSTTSGGTSSIPCVSWACEEISGHTPPRCRVVPPRCSQVPLPTVELLHRPSFRWSANPSQPDRGARPALARPNTIRGMCRILTYLGEPLVLRRLLFDPDNSLVRQSYSPRMMNTFLNLAGFGMQAWDTTSLQPEDPFTYRATTLPSFDRNLRFLSSKLAPNMSRGARSRRDLLRRGRCHGDESPSVPL